MARRKQDGSYSLRKKHSETQRCKLTLRFDEPTELSDDESKLVQKILDNVANELEQLLKQSGLKDAR